MAYQWRESLSFCWVNGHLVFLDVHEDRYFRLSDRLETIVTRYLNGNELTPDDWDALIRREMLSPASVDASLPSPCEFRLPTSSVLEQPHHPPTANIFVFIEVFFLVVWMRWQLKNHKLESTLDRLVSNRQRAIKGKTCTSPDEVPAPALLKASAKFLTVRRWVPIDTICLLDSLCLVRFLARRRWFVNMVFGVTDRPFAAHCWVQADDLVLNDTVGYVIAYRPIRVI